MKLAGASGAASMLAACGGNNTANNTADNNMANNAADNNEVPENVNQCLLTISSGHLAFTFSSPL